VKVVHADGSNRASDPAALQLDSVGHSIAAYDRRVIVPAWPRG
jgi:hypothetical protein